MEEDTSEKEESPEFKWWNERSRLEKHLLILLVVFAILMLGTLMYSAVKPSPAAQPCSSPDCVLAASQIINHIDPAVNPCDDFLKFSCGKFIENTLGNPELAPSKISEELRTNRLKKLLNETIKDDDHYVIKNQKKLFQACMDEATVEKESLKVFNQTLKEMNGWPVAVGPTWKENLFNWTDMTIKFRRKGYADSVLLDIGLGLDPTDSNKFLINISPTIVKKVENEDRELYKQYMIDVAVAFGAKERRAEEDMEKVLDFMEKLAELGELDRRMSPTDDKPRRCTVEKFESFNYEIQWLDLINDIISPTKKISKDDYILVPTSEFIDEFIDLVYRTPKRIQANYMIWKLVESAVPFLSKNFKEMQSNFYHLTKKELPWKDQFDLCANVLSETFHFIPAVITYARTYLPTDAREKVQDLFSNVKSEFIGLLTEATWMQSLSKEKAIEKVDGITEIIGTHGDYFDDEIFSKQIIHKYGLIGNTFFNMYLNATKNYIDEVYSLLHFRTNRLKLDLFSHNLAIIGEPIYGTSNNMLVLPVGFLEDNFHSNQPMYINYGSAGFPMGTALTGGFCKTSSDYDKDGEENSIWTVETEKNYEEQINCFNNDLKQFDMTSKQNHNDTLMVEDIIRKITGLKTSYKAYKNWVDQNGEEQDLVGLDYSSNQMFWISAMMYQCSAFDKTDLEHIFNNYEQKAFEVTIPFRHNSDFANDFGCNAGTNMNPSEKCQVF